MCVCVCVFCVFANLYILLLTATKKKQFCFITDNNTRASKKKFFRKHVKILDVRAHVDNNNWSHIIDMTLILSLYTFMLLTQRRQNARQQPNKTPLSLSLPVFPFLSLSRSRRFKLFFFFFFIIFELKKKINF